MSNGALGDGLFKDGDGQQSLPLSSHQENEEREVGQDIFSVLHVNAHKFRLTERAQAASGALVWFFSAPFAIIETTNWTCSLVRLNTHPGHILQ